MDHHKHDEVVQEVARRSGLKVATVHELLHAGYSYVEHIHESPKWIFEPWMDNNVSSGQGIQGRVTE
jgi:hypothetical protein